MDHLTLEKGYTFSTEIFPAYISKQTNGDDDDLRENTRILSPFGRKKRIFLFVLPYYMMPREEATSSVLSK